MHIMLVRLCNSFYFTTLRNTVEPAHQVFNQMLKQKFLSYRDCTHEKLQLINEKMDYLLLKQKGSEYEKCFVNPVGDKRKSKMPVHMGYRENKGLFRNFNHAEKLRVRTNEEDDVQWRRRNNFGEENEKEKELKHHKLVLQSFTEDDNVEIRSMNVKKQIVKETLYMMIMLRMRRLHIMMTHPPMMNHHNMKRIIALMKK